MVLSSSTLNLFQREVDRLYTHCVTEAANNIRRKENDGRIREVVKEQLSYLIQAIKILYEKKYSKTCPLPLLHQVLQCQEAWFYIHFEEVLG